MKKGFEFWVSTDISAFLKKYWVTYGVAYLVAVILTIVTGNPFVFFVVGLVPCPIIWIYRSIHDPLHNIEDSILKCDPEFYNSLLLDITRIQVVRILTSENRYRKARFFSAVKKFSERHRNQSILKFIRNNERINQSGMFSLAIWSFTFVFFLFALYFKQQ
jgi:hypothetical protein